MANQSPRKRQWLTEAEIMDLFETQIRPFRTEVMTRLDHQDKELKESADWKRKFWGNGSGTPGAFEKAVKDLNARIDDIVAFYQDKEQKFINFMHLSTEDRANSERREHDFKKFMVSHEQLAGDVRKLVEKDKTAVIEQDYLQRIIRKNIWWVRMIIGSVIASLLTLLSLAGRIILKFYLHVHIP